MSMQLVKAGRRQIVVCSDGIGIPAPGSDRPTLTNGEKLFQAGDRMLCGFGQACEAGPGDDIASRIARLCRRADLRDSPRQFLEALRDDLQQPFSRLFAEDSSRFQWLLETRSENFFDAFCIMRKRTGEVDLLALNFPICESEGKPALGVPEIILQLENCLPRGPFIFNVGCGLERNELKLLNPDRSDEVILGSVDSMVAEFKAADATCRAEIGGMIEVAVIDADGVRWLRKDSTKPSRVRWSAERNTPFVWRWMEAINRAVARYLP